MSAALKDSKGAIEGLGAQIARVEEKVDQTKAELTDEIKATEGKVNARTDRVESRLGERIDRVESGLGERIDRAETRLDAQIRRTRNDLLEAIRGRDHEEPTPVPSAGSHRRCSPPPNEDSRPEQPLSPDKP